MRKLPITNYQLLITKKGFTIVELLVSMGVFVVLLGIVVNIFISSLRSQQAMVGLMATNDNASLTLEQMSREMRTGTDFQILPLPMPEKNIKFVNASDKTVTYWLANNTIVRGECDAPPTCGAASNYTSHPISGANVKISKLKFFIGAGLVSPASWPPRITVTLEVGSTHPRLQGVTTKIQTTISARNI